MILIVTGISTLIHLYSVAYMHRDRGYARYFAYLNYFVFSMLLLVLAGNFVLLIVGWAFVGTASYLLISFWYRRRTATKAGIKAFVINVVGDVGLVLGAFLILEHSGSLEYLKVFHAVESGAFPAGSTLTWACLLLLVGAFAKSAQIPLHTWLADAMEGPTPVSSLIHAATMVTAGVYLIARMHVLFEHSHLAQDVGASIGALTLVIAGTIALVQTDIKRVIAYSTMSQIGYMIMGVSVGAYAAGLFHLMTHAFFKALLFMAAGSIIGAMGGEQSLNKMGGFRKALPFTFACFIIGGLALTRDPAVLGLLLQGRDPARHRRARRLALDPLRDGLHRRVPDRDLHVPDDLPRVLGRSGTGGRGARRTATRTTPRARRTPRPAKSRTPTSASPGPSTRSPRNRGR